MVDETKLTVQLSDEIVEALRAGYHLAAMLRAFEDNVQESLSDDDNVEREALENDIENALRIVDPDYLKQPDDGQTKEGDA